MPSGQARRQSLLLLKIQRNQRTAPRLQNAACLRHRLIELTLAARRVHHDDRRHIQLFIRSQRLQQALGIVAVCVDISRDDVDIVSRTKRLLLFADFGRVQHDLLLFNQLDGGHLIHRLNV